jgi:hypothetical protein
MMQIRWLVFQHPNDIGTQRIRDKKLQYREVLNPMEIGLQEPIWSEWTDVNVVIEENEKN